MRKIFLVVFVLLCGVANSQIYLPVNPTAYGDKLLRLKPLLVLHTPEKDTTKNDNDTTAQIFYRPTDSTFWGWSRHRGYFKVGFPFDSSFIYDLANSKLSISDTSVDGHPRWMPYGNGVDTVVFIHADTFFVSIHYYKNGNITYDTTDILTAANINNYITNIIDTAIKEVIINSIVIDGDTLMTVRHNTVTDQDSIYFRMDSVSLIHGGYLTRTQYAALLAASGGGSVVSVSDLPPLFTTTNPTTTPTFVLSNTSQYKIFGRKLSGSGVPSYNDADSSLILDLHSQGYYDTRYLNSVDTGSVVNFYQKVHSLFSSTAPITYTNGLIGITQSGTGSNGYLSSTDWNTFNNKGSGTVTNVAALTLGTTGTDLSSSVANSTTTPVITLNVPTASASNRGALSSTDWTTFNNKQDTTYRTPGVDSIKFTINGRFHEIVDSVNQTFSPLIPTPVAGTTINNSLYNAFGFTFNWDDGTLGIIYRQGTSHVGDVGKGVMRLSKDGGKTWGAAVTIDSSALDSRNFGGSVTKTGRLVVFMNHYNTGTLAFTQGYRYTDDRGATWSAYTIIPQGANSESQPYGAMIRTAGDTLLMGWGGLNGSTWTQYVIKSIDNGATWGTAIPVLSSSTLNPIEGSFIYLSGSYILGIIREVGGTAYRQVLSSDNGNTWTDQGNVTFETHPGSDDRQVWLAKYQTQTGKLVVVCYYPNTVAQKVYAVYGFATDLISGVSGWDATTIVQIGTFTAGTALYYGSIIHPYNNSAGVGFYSDELTSSNAVLKFVSTTGSAILGNPSSGGEADSAYFWSKTGNVINPATNYLGTKTNNSLRVRTNNIQRMQIDSTGKSQFQDSANSVTMSFFDYGISTPFTTNFASGTVGQVAQYSNTLGGLQITGMSNAAAAEGVGLQGIVGNTTPSAAAITLDGYKQSGTTYGAMTGATDKVLKIRGGTTDLVTVQGDGKMGVGAVTPLQQFHVEKNQNSTTAVEIKNTTSGTAATAGIFFTSNQGADHGNLLKLSAGYTTYKTLVAGGFGLFNSGEGDIFLHNDYSSGGITFTGGGASTAHLTLSSAGRLGVGVALASTTAMLHLKAGTATASTAPLKFTSGSLLTTAEAGAVEFLTDKFYGTITTGAARKEFTLNDAALTSGTTPVATTNGRLTDGLIMASGTYTPTLSNTTNVTSSTPIICHYTRVGNQVTVTGSAGVVTTLAVATVLGISLPVASNLAATTDASGLAQASSAIAANAYVEGNTSTDIAELKFTGLSVGGSGNIFFTFTYTII